MGKKKKQTGIVMREQYAKISRTRQTSSVFLWIPVGYMILGVYGWMRTALSLLGIAEISVELCTAIVLLGLWFGMLYLQKKGRRMLTAATAVLAICYLCAKREAIWRGLCEMPAMLLQSVNAVEAGTGFWISKEMTAALLAVVFVQCAVFAFCFCIETGKYLLVLWMALPVSAAFVFGTAPEAEGTFCMFFSAVGILVSGSGERSRVRGKSALFAGIFALFMMIAANVTVKPLLAPAFEKKEEMRAGIQQTSLLQEMLRLAPEFGGDTTVASGGISEGTFNDADFFLNTGEVLFSVCQQEEPIQNLYLKVYTGAVYQPQKWQKIKDSEPAAEIFYERAEEAAGMQGYGGASKLNIQFREDTEDFKYPYAPYFSKETASFGEAARAYAYYPISELGPLFGNAADEKTDAYQAYVYAHYLDYPKERLQRMEAFCKAHPCGSLAEACQMIQRVLSESASYNPQAGRFPQDEDFAEYFLFEKKEGYCVHFATAAVLLLRMYGIPARYATGFVVPPDDFSWNADGCVAEVKDERAHAWAEIYVDHFGWIPFETTPGYDSGANMRAEEYENVELPQDIKIEETETAATEPAQRQTEKKEKESVGTQEQNQGKKPKGEKSGGLDAETGIGVLAVFLIVMACLTAALFLRREMILKKRGKQEASAIFEDFYEVLLFAGMPESVDCMQDNFTEKVTEQFVWIEKAELEQIMDIVMRANFSNDVIPKEEIRQVQRMYRHVCRTLLKGMGRWKKFYFRFVKSYI